MHTSIRLGLPLCIALAGCSAIAQSAIPAGGVRTHIEGLDIPTIPNAPFTAKVIVTWDQPLVGGGTISRKYYTMVARDSQGRVHRETREFVPTNSNDEPQLRSFTILDPIAGTRTTCMPVSMNCAVGAYNPRLLLADDGGALPATNGNMTRESLGQKTMDNLPVTGIRETRAGMSGSNGSSRIALSSTDAWYSADLHMDLSVERNNPQMGQVTLTVSDLVRGEPDHSWFALPSGFQVRNAQN